MNIYKDKSKDTDMVNKEVGKLEEIYGDMIAISNQMKEQLSLDEAEKMSVIITVEEGKVFEMKKLVLRWLAAQRNTDAGSVHSRSSKRSNRSSVSRCSGSKKGLLIHSMSRDKNVEDTHGNEHMATVDEKLSAEKREQLQNEASRVRLRLENQKSLFRVE